jgi:hypothetical protein
VFWFEAEPLVVLLVEGGGYFPAAGVVDRVYRQLGEGKGVSLNF